MTLTLRRAIKEPVDNFSKWEVQLLSLEDELISTLSNYISIVMEGILDPDIAGKKPDRFLENLQSGKLGDFSKRYIIIALDCNKVIGLLIGLHEDCDKLHIFSMGVIPEYRNSGVASTLLTKCMKDMFEIGNKEILLDVHSDNIPAHNLYVKFGFQ